MEKNKRSFTDVLESIIYWDASYAIAFYVETEQYNNECVAFQKRLKAEGILSVVSNFVYDEWRGTKQSKAISHVRLYMRLLRSLPALLRRFSSPVCLRHRQATPRSFISPLAMTITDFSDSLLDR